MTTFILMKYRLSDFASWKKVYDEYRALRAKAGVKEKQLLRSKDDPHEVILLQEAKDIRRAKPFLESTELAENMEQAGVIGKPDITYLENVPSGFAEKEAEELAGHEEVYTEPIDRKVAVEFVYEAPKAKKVSLSGNFNNWDTASLPMKKNRQGQWKTTVLLYPGTYEYRYLVDGAWATDVTCREAPGGSFRTCSIDVSPAMAA